MNAWRLGVVAVLMVGAVACEGPAASRVSVVPMELSHPRPLTTAGLKAEVVYYTAGEAPRAFSDIEVLPLIQKSYGRLSVEVSRELPPGSYLMRIYPRPSFLRRLRQCR